MLSGLISVIRISPDAAHDDKGDNSSSDSGNNSDKNTDNNDAEPTDNADNTSNNESERHIVRLRRIFSMRWQTEV